MKFLNYYSHLVNRLNILELTQFIYLNLNQILFDAQTTTDNNR